MILYEWYFYMNDWNYVRIYMHLFSRDVIGGYPITITDHHHLLLITVIPIHTYQSPRVKICHVWCLHGWLMIFKGHHYQPGYLSDLFPFIFKLKPWAPTEKVAFWGSRNSFPQRLRSSQAFGGWEGFRGFWGHREGEPLQGGPPKWIVNKWSDVIIPIKGRKIKST